MDRISERPRRRFDVETLRRTAPLRHALLWIGVYVATVNVGDGLSAAVGAPNAVTALLLVLLSTALLASLARHGLFGRYGLRLPSRRDVRTSWSYAPLALVALAPVALATGAELDATAAALAVLLMTCVGFLEEAIFRGFLYRALLASGGVARAVVISGVTFGLGHVVNLARGYTGAEQIVQIVVGVALGVVLALLVAVTGSLLPGVAFHVLLNVGGTLTARGIAGDVAVMAITLVVCAIYGTHLVRTLRRRAASGPPTGRGVAAGGKARWRT